MLIHAKFNHLNFTIRTPVEFILVGAFEVGSSARCESQLRAQVRGAGLLRPLVADRHRASEVHDICGTMPALYVREGSPADAIEQLIEEEPRIAILVLGAGTGKKGPGPLVSSIAGKLSGKFPIPITVVPGNLNDEQIDALT